MPIQEVIRPSMRQTLGIFAQLRADPWQEFKQLADRGAEVDLQIPRKGFYIINDAGIARNLLEAHDSSLTKGTKDQRMLRDLGAHGLFTIAETDGEWSRQRDLVEPLFHGAMLAQYAGIVTEKTRNMILRWEGLSEGKPIHIDNLEGQIRNLTLRIISTALFDYEISDQEIEEVNSSLNSVFGFYTDSVRNFGIPWLFRQFKSSFVESVAKIEDFADTVITRRKESGKTGDLLATLMGTEGLNDEEIKDNILTFLIAGHETTTTALVWTLIELSKAEAAEYRGRIQEEIRSILPDRTPTMKDLRSFKFTRRAFQEALRLHPPVSILTRKAREDIKVGENFTIPKGSYIVINIVGMQGSENSWHDAQTFNPDRFREEGHASSLAYMPFGAGPRICVGSPMAMMEGPLILAMLFKEFGDVKIKDSDIINHDVSASIRPDQKVVVDFSALPAKL